MSNIVGEGFPKEIVSQIKTRQLVYGSANRTNQQLSYLEARTGWAKLVSSVNVKTPIRGITLTEDKLAKAFVLFNGVTNESTNIQKSGVWPGTGTSNSYAYGIGGTAFGLRPMPGIKSVSTKTETRGSLKTSTIQIQANNREQFDIIDVLYMRLGFTLFLEFTGLYTIPSGFFSKSLGSSLSLEDETMKPFIMSLPHSLRMNNKNE